MHHDKEMSHENAQNFHLEGDVFQKTRMVC